MTRYQALTIWLLALLLFYGCSSDDDNNQSNPPGPSNEQLLAGPEQGKQFLRWNDLGLQRAQGVNFSVSGWCYPGQQASIEIPTMVGLSVPGSALTHDSLQCTVSVPDSNYAQFDYFPEGTSFADSVTMWLDTTVVTLPSGVAASDIAIYYYSPQQEKFYELPTEYAVDQQRWKAKTIHFSRYILGQKQSVHNQ